MECLYWSSIARNQPHVMIGTEFPEASYWLLRSEDEYSENLVEQGLLGGSH